MSPGATILNSSRKRPDEPPLSATVTMAAAPAEARDRWGRHRGGGDDAAIAIAAGIAGLAIGAAVSNGNRGRYYNNNRYDRGGYYYPQNRGSYYYNGYPQYNGYNYYNYDQRYRNYDRGYRNYDRYDRYNHERKHERWHDRHDRWDD